MPAAPLTPAPATPAVSLAVTAAALAAWRALSQNVTEYLLPPRAAMLPSATPRPGPSEGPG